AGLSASPAAERLQLPRLPGGERRHLARLPVLVLLLRPLDLGTEGPLPRRRLRRPPVPARGGPRRPPHPLLRRPVHGEPAPGGGALRAVPRRGLPLHVELQQPPEPARSADPPAHAPRGLLADRLRHRVGLAAHP